MVLWVKEATKRGGTFHRRPEDQIPCAAYLYLRPAGCQLVLVLQGISRAGDPAGLHTPTDRRRTELGAAVKAAFGDARGLHGSPRLVADLRDLGYVRVGLTWPTCAVGLAPLRRRRVSARQDKKAPIPDLLNGTSPLVKHALLLSIIAGVICWLRRSITVLSAVTTSPQCVDSAARVARRVFTGVLPPVTSACWLA